jgi:hypothetical protein
LDPLIKSQLTSHIGGFRRYWPSRPHTVTLTTCRNILPQQYASDHHPSYTTDGRSLTPTGHL